MKRVMLVILFILSIGGAFALRHADNYVLVYKDIGNPPFMDKAPGNSGLYFDIFNQAVKNIGATLEIQRLPKKRTYLQLEKGRADLYPSGTFHEFRSRFLYYFPNGLFRYEAHTCLTPLNVNDIKTLKDFGKRNLIWILERGNSSTKTADSGDLPYQEVLDLNIEKAISLISGGRQVVYSAVTERLDLYKKKNGLKSLAILGIKEHLNCRKAVFSKLYTGISRRSHLYGEISNPNYNSKLPLSTENFPMIIDPNCNAHKLMKAIEKMAAKGVIKKLAKRYSAQSL